MKRTLVLVGVLVAVAVVGFAQELDVPTRLERLEARVARLQERTDRLEAAFRRSEEATATLTKQVKLLSEAQARFASAITVEPSGGVRISGNLRLDANVLEDPVTVDCDNESSGTTRRRCACPDGRVTTGIELRPMAVSSMPGPSTYNTALVCSRM